MDMEEEIKPEPMDDYEPEAKWIAALQDHDYCKNPKLEELLEPKLEEPDYFKMDRPSEISPEPANFEYPEYLKLESVGDYGSKADEPTQAQTTKPLQRQCLVCSIVRKNEYFVTTKSKIKLIVIIGAVLNGKMPISMAKASFLAFNSASCPNHLQEAVDEIFKFLKIKHVNQMYSCSKDKRDALTAMARSVSSRFYFSHLFETLVDCFRKNGLLQATEFMNKESTEAIDKRRPSSSGAKFRCCVCFMFPNSESFTSITSSNRRLILMTGLVLSGKKKLKEAQSDISKWKHFICKHHLSDAVDGIFRALNVKNIVEMKSCSMDNKKSVMTIVNSLSTEYSFPEFSRLLYDFVQKVDYMKKYC